MTHRKGGGGRRGKPPLIQQPVKKEEEETVGEGDLIILVASVWATGAALGAAGGKCLEPDR